MILVTGANGVVGKPLCRTLQADGMAFFCVSRQPDAQDGNALQWQLPEPLPDSARKALQAAVPAVDTLIHCAPLWLLPPVVPELASLGVTRLLVFSSTSVVGKQTSANAQEQQIVRQLRDAEQALLSLAERYSLQLTIFRPSMIYGYGLDENVTRIASMIRRMPLIPLAGTAQGLRQPVHADDLVAAVLAARQSSNTFGKTYNLAGAERLSYRDMVKKIGEASGRAVRFLPIPVPLYRLALRIAAKLGRFSYTADMADRMNHDLIYDDSDARADFSYAPQRFLQQPERDLPSMVGKG